MLERLRILKRTDRTVLQVLETHIFHSFLKDRLNRNMDSFARMELSTRSEMQKYVNFFNLISIEVIDNIKRGTNLVVKPLLEKLRSTTTFIKLGSVTGTSRLAVSALLTCTC